MSVFEDGVDAAFDDENIAKDALWMIGGTGNGVPCRTIRTMPQKAVNFGSSKAILDGIMIKVRRSEVAEPAAGDTVTEIGTGTTFKIIDESEPRIDVLGIVWTCEVKQLV